MSGAFAGAARRYWLGVFPGVCAERRRREARALQIPDPLLQRVVRDALHKWGNIEGATAFAAFVPARRRAAAARAMASFQAAYNYLDMLSELPNTDPMRNGQLLHRALLVALDPSAAHPDYYEGHHLNEDGGYLVETVEECRAALAQLPSYEAVAPAALRACERIVAFQSCNTGAVPGDHAALERWARAHAPAQCGLRWWEVAAAAGSSLGIYALLAAAAQPRVSESEIEAIEQAYFPWIGALHSLLDNLVDIAEDYATGQRSLVGCYASSLDARTRMQLLADEALQAAEELPSARGHVLVLAAMASFYLCTPEAAAPAARPVAQAVLDALGEPARLAMSVFRVRMRLRKLMPAAPGTARRGAGAEVVLPAPVDAPSGVK